MQIRTITVGVDAAWPFDPAPVRAAGRFLAEAKRRFLESGIGVQTVRLATQPFPEVLGWERPGDASALALAVEAACVAEGIDYCSLGPVAAGRGVAAQAFYDTLPPLICATERIFATVEVASAAVGVDFAAVAGAARAIKAIAAGSCLGFGNLRFAALANCLPNTPFFPAAYHAGGPPRFALALEMADVAVTALAAPPAEAEANLTAAVEAAAGRVEQIALGLEREFGIGYAGVDLSPAPFPERERSIGEAVERLGIAAFGSPGTLYAAALITRALRRARVKRCGFSGLMMPVLEDSTLARRAGEGIFTIQEALAYSAVCGTGLDTVPLPGDVALGQLEGVLLDVAALALTLNKPLTARLMPVPGKKAGEATEFDFPYFANSTVLRLPGPDEGAAEVVRRALGEAGG